MNFVAIMGFGTVGKGVYSILASRGDDFTVCRILDRKSMCGGLFTQSFADIVGDSRISIAVECMGGTGDAFEYTLALLRKGVSVVTSNKSCVERYGDLLMREAARSGAKYMYEAAVGGGIPCVAALRHMIKSDTVTGISGILNGTSNSILCAMQQKPYAEALRDAIAMGVAEADPTDDVSGLDSARKLVILCRIAWGKNFGTGDVSRITGIDGVTPGDIAAAAKANGVIKLIASASYSDGRLCASVAPQVVPFSHIFASASGTQNIIRIGLKYAGEVALCGLGAGGIPTASAVVADMYKCID